MGDTSQDSTLRSTLETEPGITPGVEESQAEAKESQKTVGFYKLFSFADSRDKVLMTLGTIGAVGSGLALPLMSFLVGELIDAFGSSQADNMVSRVSKVCT